MGGRCRKLKSPSWGIALVADHISAAELENRFRRAKTPVVVRIEGDHVLLDLRTVAEDEEDTLLEVIAEVIR